MNLDIKRPEILSPAGSFEAFLAAINGGCDAVYIGGKKFGARAYASNFTQDEIKGALEIAHLNNVKVYYTANTIFKQNELEDLIKELEFLYKEGIDAIIIQDLGIYNIVKKSGINIPLHSSTQMTIHSLAGAKYIQELGFERVVLSRELSLDEIKNIKDNTNIELECFVHGALCYSYSGQCLFSSIIGGRSGNRGRCAQPCRLPYKLYEGASKLSGKEQYLLSPKDIQTLDIIPDLIRSGISSFKIEGRMKSPEYVGLITNLYKKYIDLYYNSDSYKVNNKDVDSMLKIYNRGGFSTGYYYSNNGKDMMSMGKPNHEGILIGKVSKISKNLITLKLNEKVKQGDCIEISTNVDNYSFIAKNNSENNLLQINNNNKNIRMNDNVYKLKDTQLISEIEESILNIEKKVPISGRFEGYVGNKSSLTLKYKTWTIKEVGDIVQEAKTNPLSEDKIINQIKKTGDYPVYFEDLEVNIDNNIFMPISSINNIRRNAIEKLIKIIIDNYKRNEISLALQEIKINNDKNNTENKLSVLIRKKTQFEIIKKYNIDRIYIEMLEFTTQDIYYIINYYKDLNTEIYIALPKITRDINNNIIEEYLIKLSNLDINGFLVRTIDQYSLIKNISKDICLDYSLNVINNYTINFWNDKVTNITLSIELNNKEIRNLNNANTETIIYGHIPLMTSAQCVYNNTTSKCNKGKKAEEYLLEDRKGISFIVSTDCKMCNNIIYNSHPLILMDKFKELNDFGVKRCRLEFLNESEDEIKFLMESALKIKNNNVILIDEIKDRLSLDQFTRGHYNRGIK